MSDNSKYVETKIHYINVEDRHIGGGGSVYRENVTLPVGWEVIEVLSVPTIVRMTKQVRDGHYTQTVECEPQVLNMPALLLGRRENAALEAMQKRIDVVEANAYRVANEHAVAADNLRKRTEEVEALKKRVQDQVDELNILKRDYELRAAAAKRAELMAGDLSQKLDKVREYVGEKTFKEALEQE